MAAQWLRPISQYQYSFLSKTLQKHTYIMMLNSNNTQQSNSSRGTPKENRFRLENLRIVSKLILRAGISFHKLLMFRSMIFSAHLSISRLKYTMEILIFKSKSVIRPKMPRVKMHILYSSSFLEKLSRRV